MDKHEKYMQRCLELALHGQKTVAPNPMVGSVIVKNDCIIGEGYHQKYGEAHAEVNAIHQVQNHEDLKDATLYVNLEPCAHHGKTPPCSDLIIEKKIPRVVIGCTDSFEQVSGKGIQRMRAAGIEVLVGVLEKESLELNRRFFTFHQQKRPYILLKWAETIDGYIDIDRTSGDKGISWITHPYLRVPVHKWRSEEAGIMVGSKTAENDNPSLNTRDWAGESPTRFVLDRDLSLPAQLKLMDGSIQTYVVTEKTESPNPNVNYIRLKFSSASFLKDLFYELYKLEIQSLIIEGGRTLLQSVIDAGLWDEARVFIGNKTFGRGAKGPLIRHKMDRFCQFGQDRILYFRNRI
jgi:diaminohydroxyphosphoribosylaminopyrimidine deaminase/5-amino-6-(5-phosphoribosylamino)uracil reductase